MRKGGNIIGGIFFLGIAAVVIGVVAYLVFFAPGENYKVHVTLVNSAPGSSVHGTVYIGNNVDDKDNQNSNNLMYPGKTRTYDLNTKFANGTTPSYKFQAVENSRVLDKVTYYPTTNESSITVTWDGTQLTLKQTS
jgi:hypothetical protein